MALKKINSENNLDFINNLLKKEHYEDLGWSAEGVELKIKDKNIQKIVILDDNENSQTFFIDNLNKQILRCNSFND